MALGIPAQDTVYTHPAGTNPHGTTKDVGLGNVDNTSDLLKPISDAVQTALDGKVDNSRVLTDVPVNAKFTDTIYSHLLVKNKSFFNSRFNYLYWQK